MSLTMTALGGTAYKVGDKIMWECTSTRCAGSSAIGVTRPGTISALGPAIAPGSGPGLPAFGRPGEFWCDACHRRSETVFPPDAAGTTARAEHRMSASGARGERNTYREVADER